MASSADQQHRLPTPYCTTSAPPPTPSAQPNHSTSEAADALSRLLHRLPPTLSLSLPYRRSSPPTTITTPPTIYLSDPIPALHTNLLSASQLGFFQLTHHSIPSHLAHSAESESLSLFNLPHDRKQQYFTKNWPLGFDFDDEDDESGSGESFCLDSSCSTESTELNLTSLRKFTLEMEKVGLEVIEALSCAIGFENPVREDPTRVSSLMWISEGSTGNNKPGPVVSGRFYPYVVGLHYQIRCQKYSMLADSGWVCVSPQVDSVLVTLGDIAQVWSNGKLRKVRGRPAPNLGDGNHPHTISMSLLMTLPVDSTVSPLLLPRATGSNKQDEANREDNGDCDNTIEERVLFNSFSFEDYAWRVYHEQIILKDPLARYRV
ncbi:unnamed protein product [Ilex paraguariensis]|uniref:Non-haem dioxygenase N-terminal domain-containing protein n=1 Tax=Ilex paraguariensis TaxID=185542 RepID=A0ABC8TVL3_9AQUA